ncbi:MAG: L-seryl-tRNA(Sec) selenium transferase [Thermoguttaceae bacterium]
MSPNPLRSIPSVNDLLENPTLGKLVDRISHNVLVSMVRTVLDEVKHEVQTMASEKTLPSVTELAERVARRIAEEELPPLRPVINATGVLLHTDLGSAPLAEEAIAEMCKVAGDYASVEIDLGSGQQSQRVVAVEELLKELTGAEAAYVVNNSAGATMLTLAALAGGREVVVSRGHLIESGGSFRLPNVVAASGAVLRDVGTTNITHLDDYAGAIGKKTAALMLVHSSNFMVTGFAKSVGLNELVPLARRHKLPLIYNIGSGALLDFSRFGFDSDPLAGQCIKSGADVVLFSGDKMLGGPQCGIILGRQPLVEQITRHPIAPAMQVGELTLSALAGTLRLYRHPEEALRKIPLLHMLSTSVENLKNRATRLAPQIAAAKVVEQAEALEGITYLDGGSLPNQKLTTWCVAIKPSGMIAARLAASLRCGKQAVIGRVQEDRLLLDMRSVLPRQDMHIVEAVETLGGTNRNEKAK